MRGLVISICCLALALAGCTAKDQSASATSVSVAKSDSENPAASYGSPLTPHEYRLLVVGNTLFRPLALGGVTAIYIAPGQFVRLRLQTAEGKIATDKGRQTISSNEICWRWERIGTQCFRYYWNGRLLTFVDVENHILPTQFLVQKGNPERI
jgi:hypothetical protein